MDPQIGAIYFIMSLTVTITLNIIILNHVQIGISTWCIALVTIEIVLPNKAVSTGILARLFQLAIVGLGFLVLHTLSDRGAPSTKYSIGLPKTTVDFTMVPRREEQKFQ